MTFQQTKSVGTGACCRETSRPAARPNGDAVPVDMAEGLRLDDGADRSFGCLATPPGERAPSSSGHAKVGRLAVELPRLDDVVGEGIAEYCGVLEHWLALREISRGRTRLPPRVRRNDFDE
jgi:hypothetical protein